MKDKNIVELQIDLVNQLWSRGWAGFKADAIGMDEISGGFVIGFKNGRVIVLKILKLGSGSSKKKVGAEKSKLNQIKDIARPAGMMQDMDITVGFAIARGWSEEWYFMNTERSSIKYDDNMVLLSEVLEP